MQSTDDRQISVNVCQVNYKSHFDLMENSFNEGSWQIISVAVLIIKIIHCHFFIHATWLLTLKYFYTTYTHYIWVLKMDAQISWIPPSCTVTSERHELVSGIQANSFWQTQLQALCHLTCFIGFKLWLNLKWPLSKMTETNLWKNVFDICFEILV